MMALGGMNGMNGGPPGGKFKTVMCLQAALKCELFGCVYFLAHASPLVAGGGLLWSRAVLDLRPRQLLSAGHLHEGRQLHLCPWPT